MYMNSTKHINNLNIARKKALEKIECIFCNKLISLSNKSKHESSCWKNPLNIKLCIVCNNPIKNYKENVTCGYSCSNKHFRSGPNNGSWDINSYRSTCFFYHKKECVICKESNVVEVHHFDKNKNNNNPSNLIPLCPTHHRYLHSKFKNLIEDKIIDYIKQWSEIFKSK